MTDAPKPVRVSLVGMGAIGREVWKALVGRSHVTVVSVVDPALIGRDAGEVAGVAGSGVRIVGTVQEGFAPDVDVALLLTTSGTAEMVPTLDAAASAGVDVVSSCEDLAYAPLATPELARAIDARARQAGVTVLGTGVNPGFVMDRLPLQLAAACVRVNAVRVERVVDAAKRRGPLRAKVGADLTPEEFSAGVAARRLGHRGLPESCALIGVGLRRPLDDIRSVIEPVVTSAANPRAGIAPGRVAGLRQSAIGIYQGREIIRLDLEMSVSAPDPHDRIWIDGDPPLDVLINGGTHGDRGTVGTVINAIPAVVAASPGLKTVLDLPLYGAD
ncbi:MAG TPA: dihydrodipicolinate reductase [Polyangia bacterium]|jgi:4-hydroxy-tetrahydrodipicolinate reductase|nr:dihydrodipicolinate reductase [Polyangia bacterium]